MAKYIKIVVPDDQRSDIDGAQFVVERGDISNMEHDVVIMDAADALYTALLVVLNVEPPLGEHITALEHTKCAAVAEEVLADVKAQKIAA